MPENIHRPNVPEELDDRLADTVNDYARIPSDRLTFSDRLTILLEEYDNQAQQLVEKEKEITELERQLDEERSGMIR
jgi:hypothetical protein